MKILVIDDQRSARRVLLRYLSPLDDTEVIEADSVSGAMTAIQSALPDLVLVDLRLSDTPTDRGGLDILRRMQADGATTPVIVVSGITELAEIREAMRLGARDYVFKDELSPEMLLPIIATQRERLQLGREVARLRERMDASWGASALVGSSAAMERLRRMITRVAPSDSSVMIRGETGSGKELVARALHQHSERSAEPFLAVNCATLPDALIEGLLFGHERGAFTGAERRVRGQLELAGGGTLLLDEIAEMPPGLQAKLLRVLEEKRFRPLGAETTLPLSARILAATHADLEARVADGSFRQDLYYRLTVVTLRVPPLAERLDDLPELIAAIGSDYPRRLRFSEEAIAWLGRRRWPGNVRELRNLIERVILLGDDDVVTVPALADLTETEPSDLDAVLAAIAAKILALPSGSGNKLRILESAVLRRALEASSGNKSAAARLLGVDRKVVERMVHRHDEP